jgi:hypothetical protein
MKNLVNILLFFCLFLHFSSQAKVRSVWQGKGNLVLPDKRQIDLTKIDYTQYRITLKKKNKIIWQTEYEEAFDLLWNSAFFIPIIPGHYYADLAHDGNLEIGIGVYNGGLYTGGKFGLIFKVTKDRLEIFRKGIWVDLEESKSLLSKQQAKNLYLNHKI